MNKNNYSWLERISFCRILLLNMCLSKDYKWTLSFVKLATSGEPRNKIYLESSLQHISNNRMPKIKYIFFLNHSKRHSMVFHLKILKHDSINFNLKYFSLISNNFYHKIQSEKYLNFICFTFSKLFPNFLCFDHILFDIKTTKVSIFVRLFHDSIIVYHISWYTCSYIKSHMDLNILDLHSSLPVGIWSDRTD